MFHVNICHSHGHRAIQLWLTCTEKVAHKLTCFNVDSKHSLVSDEILKCSMERSLVLPLHMETIMFAQIK